MALIHRSHRHRVRRVFYLVYRFRQHDFLRKRRHARADFFREPPHRSSFRQGFSQVAWEANASENAALLGSNLRAIEADVRQRENIASAPATVAFIDIAGFSAISDVYGDAAALDVLEIFESMVGDALSDYEPPIKWIGDEAMLSFPEPGTAIQVLGPLLQACRKEPRLPLTRTGLNHGPVVRRAGDLFGSTVNIAARITALASPGQLLASQPVAEAAAARGILVRDLGMVALRSVAGEVALYEIELAPSADPAWIDPVCKMHAPYSSYRRAAPEGPWFCSPQCEEAYRRSPQTYPLPR